MKLSLVLLLLFIIVRLDAAAPATHVYLAQLWMDKYEIDDTDSKKIFIAGTLFPDIRYLETISREETHERGVTPEKILGTKCPFVAGMRLHSFVDEVREYYIKKSSIHRHLKSIPKKMRVLFLKLVEDEILWNLVHNQQVVESLKADYPQEIEAGVELHIAREWRRLMTDYLKQPPSEFFKLLAANGQGFLKVDPKTVEQWSRILPIYAEKPCFVKYTHQMIDYVMNQQD